MTYTKYSHMRAVSSRKSKKKKKKTNEMRSVRIHSPIFIYTLAPRATTSYTSQRFIIIARPAVGITGRHKCALVNARVRVYLAR